MHIQTKFGKLVETSRAFMHHPIFLPHQLLPTYHVELWKHLQPRFALFIPLFSAQQFIKFEFPLNISNLKTRSLILLTMALIPSFFGGQRSNVFDPFSLDVWDPIHGLPFSGALTSSRPTNEAAQIVNTRVDWKETPEAHVFKVDLPGLKKEEVKVEVEDGRVLQISGERSGEHEEKTDKWHRIERSSGKFLRRFRLPENAKMEKVKASMENGVLHVVVPKEEEKKAEVKAIDISG